jgi:hypothetical protein
MVTLKRKSIWNNPKDSHKEANILCEHHKSLYGLKQSLRARNKKLDASLKNIEFVRSDVDFSMYVAQMGDVKFLIVFYLNDLILVYNNKDKFLQVKEKLF